jgi:hypothetical protein
LTVQTPNSNPFLGKLSSLESAVSPLFGEVAKLKDLRGEMTFLRAAVMVRPGEFGSAIVEELPEMFTDFRENWFVLLWRDGLPDKLTTTQNVERHILRGFTDVEQKRKSGREGWLGGRLFLRSNIGMR